MARSGIPYEWLDPDSDPAVETLLEQFGIDPDELPVVITSGPVLRRPTPGSLAEYLGLTVQSLPDRCFDLVVVGGGPAGLAASVYGASEGLRTLGLEKFAVGGQAGSSSRIENYLGFPTGISGGDLTRRAMIQAEKFGRSLTAPCEATSLREEAGHLILGLSDGTELAARAVIVASGARYRRLPVDRLESSRAPASTTRPRKWSGASAVREPVIVVGGGNSAGQAAMFLSDTCASVTIVIRGRRSREEHVALPHRPHRQHHPHITVRTEAQITGLVGEHDLQAVAITDADGTTEVPCTGLFSFIGADPTSELDLRVRQARRPRLRPDRPRPRPRGPRRALGRTEPPPAALRDEPSRAVRRGRRALGLHQAGGGRRRRGVGLRRRGAPVPELRALTGRAPVPGASRPQCRSKNSIR